MTTEEFFAPDAGKRLLEEHAAQLQTLRDERAVVVISMQAEFRAMEAKWLQATMNAKKAESEHAAALAAKDKRIGELEADLESSAKAFLSRTAQRDKLRAVADEAVESARFLDSIRRRSMGTAAVADRLTGVLREAGYNP